MTAPRLWSWHLSPFAGKVRIALAVVGTEVDLIEIDPVDRPPRLRELNPSGRVPVLELADGSREIAIRESRIPQWSPQLAPPADLTRTTAWLDALRAHPAVAEVKRRGRPATELP